MQPTVITQPTALPAGPVGPTAPTAPTPTPHSTSEPSVVPAFIAGEEAKPPPAEPMPAKQGPGRRRKQPAGEIASGTAARKPARKGRISGTQNWSAPDLKALASYVEEAVPLGMNVWKRVEGRYNNEYAIPNNRQERGWDNIRDKWYKVGPHIYMLQTVFSPLQIVSEGPPTGQGEMPDALNNIFRVNDVLEDIGGLVDPEDLPDVEGGSGGGGAGGNDEPDLNDADDYATPARKNFVTSRPGADGGGVSMGGGGNNTTRRSRQTSASLADKLLSSISPDAEERQNDNRAVMRLYLQQIRSLEDTVRTRELQNDSLRQDLANLQDKLRASAHQLSRAERRVDKLQMRLEMLEMMGAHRGRSSRHRHAHRKSLSPSSDGSTRSSQFSWSPSQSASKKRRRMDFLGTSKGSENRKIGYQGMEDVEVAASLVKLQSGASGSHPEE